VFVTALVGLEKMVIPASVASGDTLKNITAVIVWIGYSLAIRFGLGTQFQGLAAVLAPILVTATPLIGVLIGSAKLYLASKTHNVPIWGYQRA
jgi:Flp pilus assembly protein protease CpaA